MTEISWKSVPTGRWTIGVNDVRIELSIKNMVVRTVTARVRLMDASVLVDASVTQSSVVARVGAASFDTGNAKRDEDVRSANFLDADAHPHIEFRSSTVMPTQDGYEINGTLTVKNASSPLTLHVQDVKSSGKRATFTATTQIDRQAVGVGRMPALVIGNTIDVMMTGTAHMQ